MLKVETNINAMHQVEIELSGDESSYIAEAILTLDGLVRMIARIENTSKAAVLLEIMTSVRKLNEKNNNCR